MKTKVSPLVVNPKSPFEGDALNREAACGDLADFIVRAETPYVLAVDAPWGAGKTVFLQMLEAVCNAEPRNIPTVFFNAWAADFHNDALAAMVGEVGGRIQPGAEGELADTVESVKDAGRKMLSRRGLGETLKGALKSAGSAAGLGAFVDGALESLKQFDPAAEYRAYRDALREFKDSLSDYAKKSGKPLVFFVDELDRCRPVFAVEVLEKIKHIFDVPGVFFVVAVNKGELAKTIRSVYGDIDAEVYLQKFFDRECPLENNREFVTSLLNGLGAPDHFHLRRQRDRHSADAVHLHEDYKFIVALCDAYRLSLRDCERVAELIASTLMNSGQKQAAIHLSIIAFFAAMSVADPAFFRRCQIAAAGTDGFARDLSWFPFAEVAEYYGKAVGCDFEKHSDDSSKKEDKLKTPYFWCCVNRYLVDAEYRRGIDEQSQGSNDHGSFAWRVRDTAEKRHVINRSSSRNILDPHPQWVIEPMVRVGKFRFDDGNGES